MTQLESSLSVLTVTESEINTISPIRAKALLNSYTVTYDNSQKYTVETGGQTYTVNRENKTCTCPSNLPRQGTRCEHLQHLHELNQRGKLPTAGSKKNHSHQNKNTAPQKEIPHSKSENTTSGNHLKCDECRKEIGTADCLSSKIDYKTCNVCALENNEIYYLNTDPSESRNLVLFHEILTNTTANDYYHKNTTMATYDFFESHPKTSPNDSVIIVSQRLHDKNCDGLLFKTDTVAVPGPLLTKALETMKSGNNELQPATSIENTSQPVPLEKSKATS